MIKDSKKMNEEISKLLFELADSLQAEDTSLFLFRDSKPDAFLDLVAVGRTTALVDLALPHGDGIAGWVSVHGKPVISNNPEEDPRFLDVIDILSGVKTKSILAVPVVYNNKTIGVVEVINKSGEGKFTESDISKAEKIAEAILPHIPEEKIRSIIGKNR